MRNACEEKQGSNAFKFAAYTAQEIPLIYRSGCETERRRSPSLTSHTYNEFVCSLAFVVSCFCKVFPTLWLVHFGGAVPGRTLTACLMQILHDLEGARRIDYNKICYVGIICCLFPLLFMLHSWPSHNGLYDIIFINPDRIPVYLITLIVFGTNINSEALQYVIFFSLLFLPSF
jgi:hypothetical protein